MATSPFSGDTAMIADLWGWNLNPKVPKQPQAAKMLSVCACVCFSQVYSLCCNEENVMLCNGTECI